MMIIIIIIVIKHIVLNTMQVDAVRQGRDVLSQGEWWSTFRGSCCHLQHKAVTLILRI